jgi:hypothetical protein
MEYFKLLLTEIHQRLFVIALTVSTKDGCMELLLANLFCKVDWPFHCFLQLFITNWWLMTH